MSGLGLATWARCSRPTATVVEAFELGVLWAAADTQEDTLAEAICAMHDT